MIDDTITCNVAFGVPELEVDLSAVQRPCRLGQIIGFVEAASPNGTAMAVGDRGFGLSGCDASVWTSHGPPKTGRKCALLDEATSDLDMHTERHVFQALDDLAGIQTIVTIAHRLEAVANPDHVLVIPNGQIADKNRPSAVLVWYRRIDLAWEVVYTKGANGCGLTKCGGTHSCAHAEVS